MLNRANFTLPIQNQPINRSDTPRTPTKPGSFASALAQETQKQELKISSHAQKRLDSSQVQLTDAHMQRLDGAVDRAMEKGSNQSLIMMDDLALVVSIKNKVVITAVDETRMKEGVFTNIDSVVIA